MLPLLLHLHVCTSVCVPVCPLVLGQPGSPKASTEETGYYCLLIKHPPPLNTTHHPNVSLNSSTLCFCASSPNSIQHVNTPTPVAMLFVFVPCPFSFSANPETKTAAAPAEPAKKRFLGRRAKTKPCHPSTFPHTRRAISSIRPTS